jgi:hypothetical protein
MALYCSLSLLPVLCTHIELHDFHARGTGMAQHVAQQTPLHMTSYQSIARSLGEG